MFSRDLVELLPRGQRLLSPQGVVPAAAGQPVAGWRVPCKFRNLLEHLGKRLHVPQVQIHLGARSNSQVSVGVIEAGKHKHALCGAAQVAHLRVRSCQPPDLFVAAHGQHLAPANSHRFDRLRFILGKAFACVDNPIEENDLRWRIWRILLSAIQQQLCIRQRGLCNRTRL